MSGWLEPLPSKRVRAVYRDSTGHRHSQTFATRKEAKAFLTAMLTDLNRGHWLDSTPAAARCCSPTGPPSGARRG